MQKVASARCKLTGTTTFATMLDEAVSRTIKSLKMVTLHDGSRVLTVAGDESTQVEYELLGQGSFGKVYSAELWWGNSQYDKVAIKKLDEGKEEDEAVYLEKNLSIAPNCGVLELVSLGEGMYASQLADGSCDELAGWFTVLQAHSIVSLVRKAHTCLLAAGVDYLDLKPSNILYKWDSSDSTSVLIFIGDLGSTVPDFSGRYVMTFEPPFVKRCKESGPGLVLGGNSDVYEFLYLSLFLALWFKSTERKNSVYHNFCFYRCPEPERSLIIPAMYSSLDGHVRRGGHTPAELAILSEYRRACERLNQLSVRVSKRKYKFDN